MTPPPPDAETRRAVPLLNAEELDHLADVLAQRQDGDGLFYNDHALCRANVESLIASHRELLRLRALAGDGA